MRAWLAAVVVAVGLAAAACGSADNGGVMDLPETTTVPASGRS